MAYILTVRLTDTEVDQLKDMVQIESCSAENKSEFIRLLLAREWNRRRGHGVPPAIQYQTAFRIGRPIVKTAEPVQYHERKVTSLNKFSFAK
jgi:hypothetical protein